MISYLIFVDKLGKMSQNLSSAAVVIGALRVNWSCYSGTQMRMFMKLESCECAERLVKCMTNSHVIKSRFLVIEFNYTENA